MSQANWLIRHLKSLLSLNPKSISIVSLCIALIYAYKSKRPQSRSEAPSSSRGQKKGTVNLQFLSKLWPLLKIVIPSFKSREVFCIFSLSALLIARTFMSISLSEIKGKIVKAIVKRNLGKFIETVRFIQLSMMGMYSLPSSMLNSALEYINKQLALQFRENLSRHMNEKYLSGLVFYQMTGIDSRISNPDQRLTQDIEKWSESLSNMYSNLIKPLLDIYLFGRKLSEILGVKGPVYLVGWYLFCGYIIKLLSPAFGTLIAQQQQKEGKFRADYSSIVNNSEGIAFYRGHVWERERVQQSLKNLTEHIEGIILKRFFMGGIDNFFVKYGAVIVSHAVLAMPVFGSGRQEYLKRIGDDAGNITRDYIKNSSYLVNLAKAIGKLVVCYKDLQTLSGYTSLIHDTTEVLDDLARQKYTRSSIKPLPVPAGRYIEGDYIKFKSVPIISPNGDVLIECLDLVIEQGMHTVIKGPNGCGKSSLFRILGELWPLFDGEVTKPDIHQMSYIPQRPYLPYGTFRDQLIYPDITAKKTDEELTEILTSIDFDYFVKERSGFDCVEDWDDTLSGGQKQKIALCRILYHKPLFAILDECTSSVSMEIEQKAYERFVAEGITLITVTHRESLVKYHKFSLIMDGNGGWEYKSL